MNIFHINFVFAVGCFTLIVLLLYSFSLSREFTIRVVRHIGEITIIPTIQVGYSSEHTEGWIISLSFLNYSIEFDNNYRINHL